MKLQILSWCPPILADRDCFKGCLHSQIRPQQCRHAYLLRPLLLPEPELFPDPELLPDFDGVYDLLRPESPEGV